MSNDIPNDDRTLGEALARSIDAGSPPQTPFAQSLIAERLARPPRRFPLVAILGAAATVVLAVAIGSWLGELRADRERSIATAPSASPTPASATPSPSPSATPPVGASTPAPAASVRVFFPREGLPPVGAVVVGAGPQASAEDRIRARLDALNPAGSPAISPGAFNPFPLSDPAQLHVASVAVTGDAASVDFALPAGGWRVASEAQARGLLQELVYTATEEPGIRRVTITENGGKPTSVGGVAVAPQLSREDVFGYAHPGDVRPYSVSGVPISASLTTTYSVDQFAPALARFVIRVDGTAVPAWYLPDFSVDLGPNDEIAHPELGKYVLVVKVPSAKDTTTPGTTLVDRSPLRAIVASQSRGGQLETGIAYSLGLDDQRPWRATVLFDPARIVIDIGGAPVAISDDGNTVVYAPAPGATLGTVFDFGGVVRAFEAGYVWRVRDASGAVIANSHGTANIGTAAVWGGYDAKVTLPSSTAGRITLEVFQISPKDGSEFSKVAIPLTVR
ncbi:MAG: GerMN domain-containing protein [Chloroflexota bacterium]|nr:GerMN domain-containing protein [Chloroflexota bacterium]